MYAPFGGIGMRVPLTLASECICRLPLTHYFLVEGVTRIDGIHLLLLSACSIESDPQLLLCTVYLPLKKKVSIITRNNGQLSPFVGGTSLAREAVVKAKRSSRITLEVTTAKEVCGTQQRLKDEKRICSRPNL